jgi:hypothetical protein
LFGKFKTLAGALHYAFPEINWNLDKFAFQGKKSGQRWLRVKIEALLPGIEIIEDFQHPDIAWGKLFVFLFFLIFSLYIFI